LIFKKNTRPPQYDFVHEHIDAAQVATNGKWFAVHGTNNETKIFQLDDTFNEINAASVIHDTKFIYLQYDNSLISVLKSIDTYQPLVNGSWILTNSLPLSADLIHSVDFLLDRIVMHVRFNGQQYIQFFTRLNGSWSFLEEIAYGNIQTDSPSWNGNDTFVLRSSSSLSIFSNTSGEWVEVQRVKSEDVGAHFQFGTNSRFINNDTLITFDVNQYQTSTRTGAYVFKRQPNNITAWDLTHHVYSNYLDSLNFMTNNVNTHDVIFIRLDSIALHFDAVGICFNKTPNITCSFKLDSCQDVSITASDLYTQHDSCHVTVEPENLNFHLNNMHGDLSIDLSFSGPGYNNSCTATIHCPASDGTVPSNIPSLVNIPASRSPNSADPLPVVSMSNTFTPLLPLYLLYIHFLLF
jgi:hypothetical protein